MTRLYIAIIFGLIIMAAPNKGNPPSTWSTTPTTQIAPPLPD